MSHSRQDLQHAGQRRLERNCGDFGSGKTLSPPWGVHVSGEQGAFGSKLLKGSYQEQSS